MLAASVCANWGSLCSLIWLQKSSEMTSQFLKHACLQVSDSFPFKWINKKWKEGFYVTSMATSGTRWAVVMSRNAGFIDQCVELDFQYPSEGIHRRWDAGASERSQHSALQCTPIQSLCCPQLWRAARSIA